MSGLSHTCAVGLPDVEALFSPDWFDECPVLVDGSFLSPLESSLLVNELPLLPVVSGLGWGLLGLGAIRSGEKMLRYIMKSILSVSFSVFSPFRNFCLKWNEIWWIVGVIITRKHAQIQDVCTSAGLNGNVVFTASPPNLFTEVKMVGGLRFIKSKWKVNRDIKAVEKTIIKNTTANNRRRHPWHLSNHLESLSSFLSSSSSLIS